MVDPLIGWPVDMLAREAARRSHEGARGHGDMGTRGETGLKEGVPKVDWGFSEWSSVKPAALSTR